ncbi:DUF6894 family protein [Methylobacterium phyllosphaerae]
MPDPDHERRSLAEQAKSLIQAVRSPKLAACRPMPRYFFHIDRKQRHVDTDGVELVDLEAARKEALRIIGELMVGNAMGDIWSGGEWAMTVADETGRELFSIRLSTSQRNGAGSD